VTVEKVLTNITAKMCFKPLSKIYDLIDKFTCQYDTSSLFDHSNELQN